MNTGPFYVEGALPGDTLVVQLLKVQINKPIGRQGSRFNQHAVTEAYALTAKYDPQFNGSWQQDTSKMTCNTAGVIRLTSSHDPAEADAGLHLRCSSW